MDLETLRTFLIAANKAGYAESGEKKAQQEPDFSKSLYFVQGDFKSHDNWFGGEPFGGRTVVFYQDKPVWMMTYYGSIDPAFEVVGEVLAFLQKALMHMPEDLPLRGPKKFEEELWRYENASEGDLGIYSGEELIFYGNKPVFEATYAGGLIDVRKE